MTIERGWVGRCAPWFLPLLLAAADAPASDPGAEAGPPAESAVAGPAPETDETETPSRPASRISCGREAYEAIAAELTALPSAQAVLEQLGSAQVDVKFDATGVTSVIVTSAEQGERESFVAFREDVRRTPLPPTCRLHHLRMKADPLGKRLVLFDGDQPDEPIAKSIGSPTREFTHCFQVEIRRLEAVGRVRLAFEIQQDGVVSKVAIVEDTMGGGTAACLRSYFESRRLSPPVNGNTEVFTQTWNFRNEDAEKKRHFQPAPAPAWALYLPGGMLRLEGAIGGGGGLAPVGEAELTPIHWLSLRLRSGDLHRPLTQDPRHVAGLELREVGRGTTVGLRTTLGWGDAREGLGDLRGGGAVFLARRFLPLLEVEGAFGFAFDEEDATWAVPSLRIVAHTLWDLALYAESSAYLTVSRGHENRVLVGGGLGRPLGSWPLHASLGILAALQGAEDTAPIFSFRLSSRWDL